MCRRIVISGIRLSRELFVSVHFNYTLQHVCSTPSPAECMLQMFPSPGLYSWALRGDTTKNITVTLQFTWMMLWSCCSRRVMVHIPLTRIQFCSLWFSVFGICNSFVIDTNPLHILWEYFEGSLLGFRVPPPCSLSPCDYVHVVWARSW